MSAYFSRSLSKLRQGLNIERGIYLAIITLSLVANLVYLHLNQTPQKWDSAAHINLAMLYANKIRELKFSDIPTLSGYYPPFVHLVGAVFFLVFPYFNSPLVLTLIFLVIGLVYLYKLICALTQNKTAALFGCAVFSLIPEVFVEARLFQLDLPLTVLTTASLYYLVKSNHFVDTKHTVLFFLLASLAQMTKWYAFMYLLVPFLSQIIPALKERHLKKVLKNLATGLLISVIIVVPWYAVNANSILSFFTGISSIGEGNDPKNIVSLANFLEYLYLSFAYQLSFPFFVLLSTTLAVIVIKGVPWSKTLCFSIAVPWAFFTLLVNKDVRYIMPTIPFFVVALGLFLNQIRGSRTANTLKSGVIVYLLPIMAFVSFNQISSLPKPYKIFGQIYALPANKYQWFTDNTSYYAYKRDDWQIKELFDYLVNNLDKREEKIGSILFAVDFPYFNSKNFDSLQIYSGTYYRTTSGYDIYYLDLGTTDDDIRKALSSYEYIITSYNPGENNLSHYNKMVEINRYLQKQGGTYFEPNVSYRLPNGEDAYLFKKKELSIFPIRHI